MVVLSPKAKKRLKKKKSIPKILDLARHDYLINTPSMLSFADLEICLDAYQKRGSLEGNKNICEENKKIIDVNWGLKVKNDSLKILAICEFHYFHDLLYALKSKWFLLASKYGKLHSRRPRTE